MNERGQVYLLAAILLALVVFLVVGNVNFVAKLLLNDDFETLSEGYKRESAKFLNELTGKELMDAGFGHSMLLDDYLAFTVDFSRYSKTQNPEFGLIYLFDTGNELFVGNYLDQDVVVFINNDLATSFNLDGCRSVIDAGASFDGFGLGVTLADVADCKNIVDTSSFLVDYDVMFIVGDVKYVVDVNVGVPEMVIVSQEFKNEQRKVFLSEDFITGNKEDISVFCTALNTPATGNPAVYDDSEVCTCSLRNEGQCETLNNVVCTWNGNDCE